jgi:cytoplasmic iron level regulating protein YaaA (DUF328/UPF0246 family)
MITIISPAKTLDYESVLPPVETSIPEFVPESEQIMKKLRSLSKAKISSLMKLSKDLTELNAHRYQEWEADFSTDESRPALLTFSGEVYRGINASEMTQEQLAFSQNHLRILSGLHGLLKPLDRIRPYRLEMGTTLPIQRKKNLYQFWGSKITDALNEAMQEAETDVLLNLASSEYFKSVDFSQIKGRVITPVFKDLKNGEYKIVMTWAKHARGAMTGFVMREGITDVEQIKLFNDYKFSEPLSSESEWVFVRG